MLMASKTTVRVSEAPGSREPVLFSVPEALTNEETARSPH